MRDLWNQHIEPPRDAGDVQAARTYVLSLIAAAAFVLTIVYTAFTFFNWQFAYPDAIWYGPNIIFRTLYTLVACGLSYVLARRGYIHLAPLPLLSILALQIVTVSLANPENPALSMWIFSTAVSATILLGGKWGFAALLAALIWHMLVMLSVSRLDLALLRDEAATGLITWVLVWVSALRMGQALTRNLAQVQRANAQVAQERDKLSTILAYITDAVLAVDQERRVLLVNDAARRLLGLGGAPVVAKPLAEALPAGPLAAFLTRVIGAPELLTEEVSWEGRTLDVSVSPAEGVGWVIVMHDITYLKQLDRVRADFVATASHDLKNPINIIKMSVDLLRMMGQLDEQQQAFLKRIDRASTLMVNLVEDLLEIARIESGLEMRMTPLDALALLEAAQEDVRPAAEAKGHTLTCEAPPSLPRIHGDPDRLRRVLTNLLSNAIKYTRSGGHVIVRAWPADGFMHFEVCDNGLGIAAEHLPRIFDRFYRVPSDAMSEVEGTGLGLSIVKAIVEQHGGQTWVESTPGVGSTFGFSVPLVAAATATVV